MPVRAGPLVSPISALPSVLALNTAPSTSPAPHYSPWYEREGDSRQWPPRGPAGRRGCTCAPAPLSDGVPLLFSGRRPELVRSRQSASAAGGGRGGVRGLLVWSDGCGQCSVDCGGVGGPNCDCEDCVRCQGCVLAVRGELRGEGTRVYRGDSAGDRDSAQVANTAGLRPPFVVCPVNAVLSARLSFTRRLLTPQ